MTSRLDYSRAAPEGMKALGAAHSYVGASLGKALAELVYLRVSQINGCAYCLDLHTRALVAEGFTVEKLALVSVWREAEALFSERERAALAWAETVTRVAETAVPEAEFAAVSAQFGEKELADLTIAIGLMNAYNRIAIAFRATPGAVKRTASHT
jgi:AhpD family alkylhydroperoxidase